MTVQTDAPSKECFNYPLPDWSSDRLLAPLSNGLCNPLVATNKGTRWFFVFGFEKNDRANIAPGELEALQSLAQELLARTGLQLDLALNDLTFM